MKTKITTLLLAVAASVGMMHAAIVDGTCGENLTWSLNTKDSTLTITGSGAMTSAPWNEYKSYIAYVNLPEGVTTINKNAFTNCTSITSITIPNSVINIEDSSSDSNGAFRGCTGLISVTFGNGLTSIGGYAFAYCTSLTFIEIPNSVTSIGKKAFHRCTGLTSITIPGNVTSIGNSAFSNCTSLTSVTIPNSVTSIESSAFPGCPISQIHYNGTIQEWIEKPWSVNQISANYKLYIGDELVDDLIIPNSVISIGNNAFEACTGLISVTISNSVTSIGNRAFSNCTSLISIEIPNNVTSIGNSTFSNCTGLTSITIPSSVTSIGANAFSNCNFTSITCEAVTPPSVGSAPFSSYSAILFVPSESVEAYQNALYWEEFTNIYPIGVKFRVEFVDWDGTILKVDSVEHGKNATPPADPQRAGYTFINWNKGFENITQDLQVIAQYNPIFRVEFVDWDGTLLKVDSVEYGKSATPPTEPTREEYLFKGWDVDYSYVTRDLSITATYQPFHFNCGLMTKVQAISSGKATCTGEFTGVASANLSSKSAEMSEYGGETGYKMNKADTYLGITFDEGLTLKAYDEVTVFVTTTSLKLQIFSDKGKTLIAETDAVVQGENKFILDEQANGAQGLYVYRVLGGTEGAQYNAHVAYISVERPCTAEDSHRVVFTNWDGTILSSQIIKSGEDAVAPANPTREGYIFIGWDKDFSNITGDLTVTAQYKINRYKVEFVDFDDKVLKSDSVDYNSPASAPANPSREGHEFTGWDKDYSHVTSDMTIKAQYAVNYYPVGFLNYDGTLLSEQSIAYNTAAKAPNVPVRDGYTFIGWTADIEHIVARTFAIALFEKEGTSVVYKSEDGNTIASEKVNMHFPDAPIVAGKTFAGWLTESANNKEGVIFRATYTLDNPTENGDVTVEPSSTTASVAFPYITGAMTYVLVIRDLLGHVVCKIMFNSTGHLLGIAFAPGRNNAPQKEQSTGFNFTVEGLTPNTTYEYEFTAHDETDQVIETLSGSFSTTADATGINNITSASVPQKIINDGNVFIHRGEKTYTLQGQEVK